jgi:hypothetical protein
VLRRYLFSWVPLALLAADALTAQNAKSPSLDVTVGVSAGAGGHYFDRTGLAGEITLVPEHEHAGLIAVAAGVHGSLASSDICALEAGPGSRCLPRFPTIAHFGLLGGWEYRHARAALRAVAGPAVFIFGGDAPYRLGAQLGVDGAVGVTHVALVGAGRAGFVAPFTREPLRLGSLELGLRVR